MLHVVHIKIHKFIIKNGLFSPFLRRCVSLSAGIRIACRIAPSSHLYLGVVRIICRKLLLSDVKQLTG